MFASNCKDQGRFCGIYGISAGLKRIWTIRNQAIYLAERKVNGKRLKGKTDDRFGN